MDVEVYIDVEQIVALNLVWMAMIHVKLLIAVVVYSEAERLYTLDV